MIFVASTYAVTGSLGHSARAGIVGWGLSAGHGLVGAHSAVGSFANIYGNALVAGFGAKLGGGQFNHAFIAAGFSAAFKSMINDIGGTNSANAAIKEGNLGKLNIHKVDRAIAAALIGGTASKLSGGKFANGTLSGALAQMYNGEEALISAATLEKLKIEVIALAKKYAAVATKTVDSSSEVLDFMQANDMPEWAYMLVRGSLIHREFSRLLNSSGVPGLFGERSSYKYGEIGKWGGLNTVRPDGIWGVAEQPFIAFELKTGKSGMNSMEAFNYKMHLPESTELVIIQAVYEDSSITFKDGRVDFQ